MENIEEHYTHTIFDLAMRSPDTIMISYLGKWVILFLLGRMSFAYRPFNKIDYLDFTGSFLDIVFG